MFNRMMDFTEKTKNKIAHLFQEEKTRNEQLGKFKSQFSQLMNHEFLSYLLPYESFDTESSLFINKKSIGFMLETTPLLGSSEEIENILMSVITDIVPEHVDVQFMLWASPKIAPILNAFERMRSKDKTSLWLAKKRTEYLKKGAHSSLSQSDALLIRNFRMFMVFSSDKKNMDSADFVDLRDDVTSTLRSIHIGSHVMNAEDLISTVSDLITPTRDLNPCEADWNEYDSLSLQVTNAEWGVDIYTDHLTFSSEEEAVEVRCLSVDKYPKKGTLWNTSENLGQLFNAVLQIPCPFLVSFSLRKLNPENSGFNAHMTSMNKKSTANSKLKDFDSSVEDEAHDWEFIKERLDDGDSLVKTFYQIILFSAPNEANYCERRVRDLYRANGWKLMKERFLHIQSWLSFLPFMMTEGIFDDLKHFGRLHTMTAFNAINIAPIQGDWKGSQTPSLLLPSRRGQIACWNPFDNEGNFNIVIVAAPRKGKSAFTNDYIIAILGSGGRMWVIDVGRSYKKTCKQWGGEFIEFSEETHICLNPFTRITNINEEMSLLKPLIASMARHTTGASEEEISFIEKAIKAAWEQKGNLATITTVSEWLSEQEHPIAKTLSHLLFSYSKEGSFARFFEGVCTIDFSNPFIVLELQALDGKKDLQRTIMQMLIFLISQAMYNGDRSQVKSCIIDEAWKQLNSNDHSQAAFIEAGYRTAPKHRGNFISIAHSVADFHGNRMSKTAFDCSDFKIILGQTEEAINKLKSENIMEIDGFKERMLKSLRITKDYSECVLISPDGWSLHRIIFDPYSRILYSTKGEEFEAVERLMRDGKTLEDAIEQVIRNFLHG